MLFIWFHLELSQQINVLLEFLVPPMLTLAKLKVCFMNCMTWQILEGSNSLSLSVFVVSCRFIAYNVEFKRWVMHFVATSLCSNIKRCWALLSSSKHTSFLIETWRNSNKNTSGLPLNLRIRSLSLPNNCSACRNETKKLQNNPPKLLG